MVVSNIVFYFHPEPWGRWTHFDGSHTFQMGWQKTTNPVNLKDLCLETSGNARSAGHRCWDEQEQSQSQNFLTPTWAVSPCQICWEMMLPFQQVLKIAWNLQVLEYIRGTPQLRRTCFRCLKASECQPLWAFCNNFYEWDSIRQEEVPIPRGVVPLIPNLLGSLFQGTEVDVVVVVILVDLWS